VECENGFGMIFVFTTITVNFFDGRQGEANYLLKRVDDHLGVSLIGMDIQIRI